MVKVKTDRYGLQYPTDLLYAVFSELCDMNRFDHKGTASYEKTYDEMESDIKSVMEPDVLQCLEDWALAYGEQKGVMPVTYFIDKVCEDSLVKTWLGINRT